jgi:hypothetical protein
MAVSTQGVLRREVQVIGDKIKNLLIPEPPSRLAVNFQRRRLKEQQVTAIF